MAKRLCDPTSGKVGNVVYQGGRFGQVLRTRAIPSNPRTTAQRLVRANLTAESKAWDTITQVKRDAWTATAKQVNSKSRLGMKGVLTGNQLFVKINTSLLAVGASVVTDPPAIPEFTAVPISGLTATWTTHVLHLALTTTGTPGEATMLRAAAPVRAGVDRCPDVKLLGTLDSPVNNKIDITTAYAGAFGTPVAGQKVFVQVNNNVDGFEDIPLSFSVIIPADS